MAHLPMELLPLEFQKELRDAVAKARTPFIVVVLVNTTRKPVMCLSFVLRCGDLRVMRPNSDADMLDVIRDGRMDISLERLRHLIDALFSSGAEVCYMNGGGVASSELGKPAADVQPSVN